MGTVQAAVCRRKLQDRICIDSAVKKRHAFILSVQMKALLMWLSL